MLREAMARALALRDTYHTEAAPPVVSRADLEQIRPWHTRMFNRAPGSVERCRAATRLLNQDIRENTRKGAAKEVPLP
jgi:hypothetical protein